MAASRQFPNAGCPFGDRFPGWRIVIDALYQDLPTRTYGMFDYGDDTYGDTVPAVLRWADLTRPSYQVNIVAGTIDGAQTVGVTEISIELHDDKGAWIDFAAPARYFQPFVGTPVRVGFLDPGSATTRWLSARSRRSTTTTTACRATSPSKRSGTCRTSSTPSRSGSARPS